MEALDDISKQVRLFILEQFYNTGKAPNVRQIIVKFGLSRNKVIHIFDILESRRDILRMKGSDYILISLPFSNIGTSHYIRLGSGRSFYCNGAIDCLGISFMYPHEEVYISDYCHHCGEPFELKCKNGKVLSTIPTPLIIHMGTPPSRWWDDLFHT